MVPILHVEDGPEMEFSLGLQDIFNPGGGVCVGNCRVVQATVVNHKSVFSRTFFRYGEGWAAPCAHPILQLTISHQSVNQTHPRLPAGSMDLIHTLFTGGHTGFKLNGGLAKWATDRGDLSGFCQKRNLHIPKVSPVATFQRVYLTMVHHSQPHSE